MANTIIGSSIVIDGEISGDEDLVIQGTVKGKISLKESLFVEGSGVVEADIDTQNVEIAGRVTGNIAASDKVELKSDCRVVGDIKAPRILISGGASFKGNGEMGVKERGPMATTKESSVSSGFNANTVIGESILISG